MEQGLKKNQLIAELSRSAHGALAEYVPTVRKAAKQEPEFLAHLIAWNAIKGQIKDSWIALPVTSLLEPDFQDELRENSLAHIADLGPRELLKAYKFALDLKSGLGKSVERIVRQYLKVLEADSKVWTRVTVQHASTLRTLYSMSHNKPAAYAKAVLFEHQYPKGSVFEKLAQLKNMSAKEAAGTILEWKIPFLIAQGRLGARVKEHDLLLALIQNMSATELVTNTKNLTKWGMNNNAALRGAYNEGLKKVEKSDKALFKTTRAAETLAGVSKEVSEKLRGAQEKQLASRAVEGNWLVLADKSGSMSAAINVAQEVSATLAKMVKGKVTLTFFDEMPHRMDVTGLALDQIKDKTKRVVANGGTSIGCGLLQALEAREELDGIAIVSDAQENRAPLFGGTYKGYAKHFDKEVPVYLYHVDSSIPADSTALMIDCRREGVDVQVFDLARNVDYYALPNMVATMRTNRYSLVDEIMATPLLTLDAAFKAKTKRKEKTRA